MHHLDRTKHIAYLGLGSNLGDRFANLNSAIEILKLNPSISLVRSSQFIENPPIENAGPYDFLNAVVEIHSQLNPRQLLDLINAIENQIDPQRAERGRKMARVLDIDILLYDDLHINEDDLQIPHPRMQSRDFVMQPLRSLLIDSNGINKAQRDLMKACPGLKFRPMYLSDLDQILRIDPILFGPKHWTREIFIQELSNAGSIYSVLELESQIVSYIGASVVLDEMHVLTIATDPGFQRRHFAEILFVQLINKAIRADLKSITLEVRKGNVSAQNLYEKYGFKNQGLRKQYYQDNGEDALILSVQDIQSFEFMELLFDNIALLKNSIVL